MGMLDKLFKSKNIDICKSENSPYYNYSDNLREYYEYCEFRDKYGPVFNLAGEYHEKINYYYSNFINTKKQDDFNQLFKYCQLFIELLPQLEEANKEDCRINNLKYPERSYCVAYHKLAMAYEKNGCYNSAINVCKEAIANNYTDGTKGGFEARLQRIVKKQNSI